MNVSDLIQYNIHEFGEYELLVWRDKSHTNVQLLENARKLASALRKMGVKKDDRVVIVLSSCPEALIAFTACAWLGAWATPTSFLLMPNEIGHILTHSGAKVIITQQLWLNKVLEAKCRASCVEKVILIDPKGDEKDEGLVFLSDLLRNADPNIECEQTDENDVAFLIYTAGTTGSPRGVMLTHQNAISNVEAVVASLKSDKKETSLAALPLYHAYGILNLLSDYLSGAKIILMSWFQPEEALLLIEHHRINATAVVPAMLIQMLRLPYRADYETQSMKRWTCSAAPLSIDILNKFEAAFGGKVIEAYGLTEAGPAVAVNRPGTVYKPGSVGPAIPGVEMEIRDLRDKALPIGWKGEICVRGPNVMKGYYKENAATQEAIRDGWLHTGDAGYLDEDGYLFITERIKDLIIRGGENIFPQEIEKVLLDHPDIAEASVVGSYDEVYGEDVIAIVVPKPRADLTEEIILEFCEGRMAKFKRPKKIIIAPMLPKTPMGKVLKRKLREQYGGFPEY